MLGAIAGDIIGSVHEFIGTKTKDFPLFTPRSVFTDDTVLTVALADALLSGRDYGAVMKEYYRRYPGAGYGGMFHRWASSAESAPYHSFGNGAAMRISPVAQWYGSLDDVLAAAQAFTAVTHDHPEGIKGAQAAAAAQFLARTGSSKDEIRDYVQRTFGYDLSFTCDEIRPTYHFDVTCQGTVPQALVAFFDSTDYEDAVRNAISLGGDADTLACITGGVAEAFHGGVPDSIRARALELLDSHLRGTVEEFAIRASKGEAGWQGSPITPVGKGG